MTADATKLSDRDIYLLGVLAECRDGWVIDTTRLPRGCSTSQLQALVRAGYVMETTHRFADGNEAMAYYVTHEGISAWNSYRFVQPVPRAMDPPRKV